MPTLKGLTEAAVARAEVPAGKLRAIIWDSAITGLGLRCSKRGTKTFVFVYRPRGAGRRGASQTLTLGHWPALSVDDARKAARARAGEIALGHDPASLQRQARHSARQTLRGALQDYEASLIRRRIVNVKTIMSSLRRGLSKLVMREVSTIARRDYVAAIDALESRGRPGAAEFLRKNARSFGEWAVTRGLALHNPLAGLRRPKASRAERLEVEERGRALSEVEVVNLWQAAVGTSSAFGGMVRLGLLTAMRRGELAGLRWSDVRGDRIHLEPRHTKQGRIHEIPLTPLMGTILGECQRGTSDLVFPSWKTGKKMSGWNSLVAKLCEKSGVDFALHDLRRTCRTQMGNLGVPEDIAEIAIGHQRKDLVRRYDFSDVWGQRIDAFQRVSDTIGALIGKDVHNVVKLRGAKSRGK